MPKFSIRPNLSLFLKRHNGKTGWPDIPRIPKPKHATWETRYEDIVNFYISFIRLNEEYSGQWYIGISIAPDHSLFTTMSLKRDKDLWYYCPEFSSPVVASFVAEEVMRGCPVPVSWNDRESGGKFVYVFNEMEQGKPDSVHNMDPASHKMPKISKK